VGEEGERGRRAHQSHRSGGRSINIDRHADDADPRSAVAHGAARAERQWMDGLMASLIPAFFTAKEDVLLRGNPFLVYLWMHDHLDVIDYRAVKILEVVAALEMRETTARHAVRLLIERGYLDRRKTEDYSDRRWCYRLIYSVAASEAPNLPKRRQNSA
jgi:hypothetical protein